MRATTLAACVVRLLCPMATAWRAISSPYSAKATCGVAPHADQPQSPDGKPQTAPSDVLLMQRAMRLGNRKPEAVDRFLRVHQALSKERCSSTT